MEAFAGCTARRLSLGSTLALSPIGPRKGVLCFSDGDVIFKQDDVGADCFVVLRGGVKVLVGHGVCKVVAVLGVGDRFGEIAKCSPTSRRTATCVAVGNTELRVVGRVRSQTVPGHRIPAHVLSPTTKADGPDRDRDDSGNTTVQASVEDFPDSTFILREREIADTSFYVIVSGVVTVSQRGHTINTMIAGEIFGEGGVLGPPETR
jgi:CRP-like cAMP-binding protein